MVISVDQHKFDHSSRNWTKFTHTDVICKLYCASSF